MKLNKKLRKFLNSFLDILFPGNCPICDGEAYKDGLSYMCVECEGTLAWIKKNGCKYCGIPMSGYDFNGLTCAACRNDQPSFRKGKCMFLLDQNGKKVVHEIKYFGVKNILDDMPSWLGRCPSYRTFLEGSVLIPVPLHKKRFSKRGFNQSMWIANAFRNELGKDVNISEVLTRTRDTPTQTKLDRSKRKRNVKNAFVINKKNTLNKSDRIVLVDDVYTTGATLNECAKTLIAEGFENVNVATLGHG